jgi:NAD(P)-dependent dehydrogenase (short-subunit alcohol dehydrogenase family)
MEVKMSGDRMKGRRVLVTGAGSGIGKATASLLVMEGARLALLDVNRDAVDSVAAETGGVAIVVDLSDEAAIKPAVDRAADALGGIDCVVNCAGVRQILPFEEIDAGAWQQIVAINLTAPFAVIRAALPYLKAANGSASIVNISSAAGLRPAGGQIVGYAATKAGLIGMTRALAMELAPRIRVNAVCPGLVDTPMTAFAFEGLDDKRDAAKDYPLRRPAEAIEIARGILFLASDDSSYLTGSAMAIDGGRTLY